MFTVPEITSDQAKTIGRAALFTVATVGGIIGINETAKRIAAARRKSRQPSYIVVLHDATVAQINEVIGLNVKCQYSRQELPSQVVAAIEAMPDKPIDNLGLHQPIITALIDHYRTVYPYELKVALVINFSNDVTVIVK